jgi:pantothenate kinase-related protein Tda10
VDVDVRLARLLNLSGEIVGVMFIRNDTPMLISLSGLPGTGKTTVASLAAGEL